MSNTTGFGADGEQIEMAPSEASLEAAFSRAFGTEPGAPDPTVQIPAEGESTLPPQPPAEDGQGGGGPSPAATPDPTPSLVDDIGGVTDFTPPADAPAETHYQIAEDGGPDPLAVEPPADPSAPSTSTPSELDFNRLLEGHMGRKGTMDDGRALMELLNLGDTINSLPPDAQAAVVHIIQTGTLPASAAQVPQAAAPPAPRPNPDDDPWGDPALQPTLPPPVDPQLQARLDQLEAQQAQQQQLADQQRNQWIGQEMSAGINDFMGALPQGVALSNEDLILLEQRVVKSGAFAQEMQRTQGANPRAAYSQALATVMNGDPGFSQRIIDARAAAIVAEQTADIERQRRAASVSAGGGQVPPPAPVRRPTNMQDAMSGMADDLRALDAAGGNG